MFSDIKSIIEVSSPVSSLVYNFSEIILHYLKERLYIKEKNLKFIRDNSD